MLAEPKVLRGPVDGAAAPSIHQEGSRANYVDYHDRSRKDTLYPAKEFAHHTTGAAKIPGVNGGRGLNMAMMSHDLYT